MHVLVFVNNIDISDSPAHISDSTEVLAVNESVNYLKRYVDEMGDDEGSVKWKKVEEKWFGEVWYDGEKEEDQYYLIVSVEE